MRITSIETKKNIGWVVREKRTQKKMSQQELCKKAKITQTFLSLLEHGKRNPSYEVLERIAHGLGEDSVTLEKEAGKLEKDSEVKLNYLLKKLLRSRNSKKLRRLIEFVETLS